MKEKLRKQRIKRYALLALAVVIIAGVIIGLNIEGKDAKIADGQGQVVTENAGDAVEEIADAAKEKEKEEKKKEEKAEEKKKEKSQKYAEEEKKKKTPKDVAVDNSKDPTASNGGNKNLKPNKPENVTVSIEIRCDTLSNHMDYLENDSVKDYIPKDGVILASTTYSGTTENTVYDALNTVCRNNNIQLDFDYTPVYESYYIKGINYLYEFDGGSESGWMYSVNGWFPNYGCSSYYLRNGDKISWKYTCRGYGADIGAN